MRSPSPEHLIEEYKIAQQKVELHRQIEWRMAGILTAGSIAGFSVLVSKLGDIDQLQELCGLFLAGAFSIAVFEAWFRIHRRWAIHDQITYHRAHEIEKLLGLQLNLDIDLFDIEIKRDQEREQRLKEEDVKRLQELREWSSEHKLKLGKAERTLIHRSIKCIKWTVIAGWILLFVAALLQYLWKYCYFCVCAII